MFFCLQKKQKAAGDASQDGVEKLKEVKTRF